MPLRPRVFVTQATDLNLLPAQDHGELVFLLARDHVIAQHGRVELDDALLKLGTATQRDMFLPLGDPLACAAFGAALFEATGKLRMLKWDRQEKRYYVVELNPSPAEAKLASAG